MVKKANLFFLVKSLTKSEKRHFRLSAANSNNNYLRLFDFIDQQEIYDETAVRKKFVGETFTKQLHVTKNYLSSLILKNLRTYHTRLSKEAELKDLLRDIEILYKRELFDQCQYAIEKTLGMAQEYEKYLVVLEACAWRRRLFLEKLGPVRSKEAVNECLALEKKSLRKLGLLNEYWHMAVNMFDMFRFKDFSVFPSDDENRVDFLSHPLIKNSGQADFYQARILRQHLMYAYSTISNDSENAEHIATELIAYIEGFPKLIAEDPSPYVTAIGNKIGFLLQIRKHDEIPALLAKIKSLPQKYGLNDKTAFSIKLKLRTFNVELELYRDTGNIEAGLGLAADVRDFLTKYEARIPSDYKLLLYYQIAYLYFLKKDHHASLVWINEILRGNFDREREDIQSIAQLLNLINHLELRNIAVLKYAVDSCRRLLKKKRKLYDFERELLRLFSRISQTTEDKYGHYFEKAYQALFAEGNRPDLKDALDYLDFKTWLEGKKCKVENAK